MKWQTICDRCINKRAAKAYGSHNKKYRFISPHVACGGIFSREEELPVLLDETFAMYDDKRLSGALKWLSRNKTQTILFTCNRREIEALEALDIPFRLVQL